MKVQPGNCSQKDFPPSTVSAPGIKTLKLDERVYSVNTLLNVEYGQKSDMPLHLTILAPKLKEGETRAFPLVLFIQGSAWFKQDLTQQLAQLVDFARRGFVIALAEYRPSTTAPFPAQIQDARTAARFMVNHAREHHGDPERLVVWGDSSGGHTAVMLALTEGDPYFSDEGILPLPIKGVVDYYGPVHFAAMNDEPSIQDHEAADSPEGMVLGGVSVAEHPELVTAASPLSYITPASSLPPFLIMHGDKDRLVPYGQSVLLYRKLVECKQRVTMYRIEGADHGGNAFWTAPEPVRITTEFIASCGAL
jgi:acetyl esterase/lipase